VGVGIKEIEHCGDVSANQIEELIDVGGGILE
jgi:hypothetical protein